MIDHKSIMNQRLDSPVEGRRDDKDSVESHRLNRLPPSPLNGATTSAERPDGAPGELKATRLTPFNRKLTPPPF